LSNNRISHYNGCVKNLWKIKEEKNFGGDIVADIKNEPWREAARAYKRAWRQKNRDKVRAYARAWARKKPEKIRESRIRYWKRRAEKGEL